MRNLAWGGVAGPVLFVVVVLVSASLRPDYDHRSNLISELGATGTPRATLMNYGGFVPAGLLLAGFGVALGRRPWPSRLAPGGAVLVVAFGAGVAASGVMSCDAGCPTEGSRENLIHNLIAPPTFLSLIASTAVFGIAFRRVRGWRHLAIYSWLSSAAALVCLAALVSSFESRAHAGLWQRLMLGILFLWCAVVGLQLRRTRL